MSDSPQRPIRVGLIGAGLIARQHLLALAKSPDFETIGLASRTREKAQALAEEFSLPMVADSPEELAREDLAHARMTTAYAQSLFAASADRMLDPAGKETR